MSTIETYLKERNQENLVIAEWFLAAEVESWAWVLTLGNTYEVAWEEGEPISITEDGVAYTEKYNIADVDATSSTFYYDWQAKILYVHTSNGDSPGEILTSGDYEYCIIVEFCVGFTNRQQKDHNICFEREEQRLLDPNLDNWDPATSWLRHWTRSVKGTTTAIKETTSVYDDDSYASVKVTVDAGGDEGAFYQDRYIEPHRKIKFRIKYKTAGASGYAFLKIYDLAENVWVDSNGFWTTANTYIHLPASTSWATYEIEFVTNANYDHYYFTLGSYFPSMVVYFDYAEVFFYRQAMYYKPFLNDESIPEAYSGVGDAWLADDRFQSGALSFLQDGWFWQKRSLYLWHNRLIKIKAGGIDFDYADMTIFIAGKTKNIKFSDEKVDVEFSDDRISGLGPLTIQKFNTTDWPNMDTSYEGATYPLVFGTRSNVVPVRVDTKKYLVSQTVFDGVTYPLQDITHVYKNGKLLTIVTDYTIDLNAGTITLVKKAKNATITCTALGISTNWETGATTNGIYDHVYFALTVLKGIDADNLNLASLHRLTHAYWTFRLGAESVDGAMETSEFLGLCRRSLGFQIFIDPDGKWNFPYYDSGVDSDALRFYDWDFQDTLELQEITDGCFAGVTVKYNHLQDSGKFSEKISEEEMTPWRYDRNDNLTIETMLILNADLVAEFYLDIVSAPTKKLTVTLPAKAMILDPMDKIYITKTTTTPEDGEISILDAVVYRVLEITKNILLQTAKITAVED